MNKHLQRILSLLCVLALVLGCTSAFAQDPTVQYDSQVLMIVWDDNNNYDGDRPTTPVGAAFVTASGNVQAPDLIEANGWTTEVSVPTGITGTWTLSGVPAGYTQSPVSDGSLTTMYLRKEKLQTVSVTARVADWKDSENAGKIRPDKVKLLLLADGEAYGEPQEALSPAWKAEWKDLPERKPGKTDKIVYTVQALQVPDGYTATYDGLNVTFTLLRSKLTLNVSVSGYPEGADLSGLSLKVDGPDPSMPRTLTWSQVSGGTFDFGDVLPGAYLVMGSAPEIEGYTMDTANSTISDAVFAKAGESASLSYKYTYKEPEPIEDADPDYDPTANFDNLSFEILGPDDSMPMKITYAQFDSNGTYTIPQNLIPGTYTVVERNAESLVNYYVLDIDSVTGAVIEVAANGTAVKKLYNKYVPAPTPEPDAEFVDVPVTKTWADEDNRDGNRPSSVTVRLYADGVEVNSHVLTAAENWNYTFTELPRYKEDNRTEIVYTVNEDAVPMYSVQINGYNLVNVYQPEVTSLTVAKHWNDNNNEAKRRPLSIFMTLVQSQGGASKVIKVVELNDSNGWIQTVGDLPVTVNGERATYTWTEQTVLNYFVEEVTQIGAVVTFTNKYFVPQPTIGGPQKKTGTPQYTVIGDYETALGMDVIINHVGDCFD